MTLNDEGTRKMFTDVNEKEDVRSIGNVLQFQFLELFFSLGLNCYSHIFSRDSFYMLFLISRLNSYAVEIGVVFIWYLGLTGVSIKQFN